MGKPPVRALSDVSLGLNAGETTGLVGESGSGKSTLVRCVIGLERPDRGSAVFYDNTDVLKAKGTDLKRFRREVQLIFQDPNSSLNPRMNLEDLVGEGLIVHRMVRSAAARRDRVRELLGLVGLASADMKSHPRSFSGGQRQRIAIARALAVEPRLLICDEPVSSLDLSVRAQIINLLQDMQTRLGLTVLFVAHDLALVRHLCTRVVVLLGGTIVEDGPTETVLVDPRDAYTRELLAAVPVPDPTIERRRERR